MRMLQEVQTKHIGEEEVQRVSLESKLQATLTADTDDSEPEMSPSSVSVPCTLDACSQLYYVAASAHAAVHACQHNCASSGPHQCHSEP
jgi:hypothetical protein